jgi:hypothetical protein
MMAKTTGGAFVTSVKVTADNSRICPFSLAIFGGAGKVVDTTFIDILDFHLRAKEGIDRGSPVLLKACWIYVSLDQIRYELSPY